LHMTKGNTALSYQKSQKTTSKSQISRLKISPISLCGIGVLLIVMLNIFYLSQYAILAHMNNHIRSLEKELDVLVRTNSDFRWEVANLGSLDRVERIAREELGMVPATEVRYVMIDSTPLFEGSEEGEVPENESTKFWAWLNNRLSYFTSSALAQTP
jgi:cell division protein FtsL